MRPHRLTHTPALLALLVAGCGQPFETGSGGSTGSGGATPSLPGTYDLTVTDGKNGCNFSGWSEGSASSGTHLVVAVSGMDLTATVSGVTANLLDGLLGTHEFVGPSSGSPILLTANGSIKVKISGCSSTWNGNVQIEPTGGAAISGTITYSPSESACACSSVQTFTGARQ